MFLAAVPLQISIHVPLAGDDAYVLRVTSSEIISIHVPLAGDDLRFFALLRSHTHFYPRPPCGGRPDES